MSSCQKHKQPTSLHVFLSKKTCLHVFLSKSISSRHVYMSSCQKDLSSCQKNNLTNLQQYGKKKLGARGGL